MEEVPTFVRREEIADFADGLDELVEGPGSDAPEVGLEHPRGGIAVVGGQVVEDDHGPWVQFGDQDFFDAAIEGIPIQGSGDHPGCHGPTAGQACDQGPVAPSPKRRAAFEPFTTWTAPVFAGHPGVGARLIQKDQPPRLPAHGLLSTAPVMPCLSSTSCHGLPKGQPAIQPE